jgi:hypothetical protein
MIAHAMPPLSTSKAGDDPFVLPLSKRPHLHLRGKPPCPESRLVKAPAPRLDVTRKMVGELAGQVLGVGRDAGIAENHAPNMDQKSEIGSAG